MLIALSIWLNTSDQRESRRFLEAHLELLDSSNDGVLEEMIAAGQASSPDVQTTSEAPPQRAKTIQQLRQRLYILRQSRMLGGTVETIRKTYVNLHGGFVLDLPFWLEEKEEHLTLRSSGEASLERITLLRETIVQAEQEPRLASEIVAELYRLLWHALYDVYGVLDALVQQEQQACLEHALQVFTLVLYPYQYARMQANLGNTWRQQKGENQQSYLEKAIVYYLQAAQVFTLATFPIEYAKTQHNLAIAYFEQREEQRRSSLEEAITCCNNALGVYTVDEYPTQYAHLHRWLGTCYYERMEEEQRSNLETGILHATLALRVFTREQFPIDYAWAHYTLGNLYSERIAQKEALDQEEAILCYGRAAQVFASERLFDQYALVQYYLGMTYKERIAGERQENLEQTIACYLQALQFYTLDAFPIDYAKVHFRLAGVYKERLAGERRENFELAIVSYQQALQVYTANKYPLDYAMIQNNLGAIYSERLLGERRVNLEEALTYYNNALAIYTHDTLPTEHARTLYNLGLIYRERIAGERQANIEMAISCYERAAQIYTLQAFPQEYAKLQVNLAVFYQERIKNTRRENIEESIACNLRALQVFTQEAFPHYYASIQNNLCNAYIERIAGEQRANIEQAIVHAGRALQVYTLEHFPSAYATVQFSLSNAYRVRIAGEQRANQEEAILYCHRALQVYTLERYPIEYARIQNNLAALYIERLMGKRGANLEEALACCTRASQVYTHEAFPKNYASVQHNLGTIYSQRKEGKRSENMEQALACYTHTLEVYTEQTFPRDYALAQNNLGNTYWLRVEGDRAQNLEEALACFQHALNVFTFDDYPMEWARLQHNMGAVYGQRMMGERAENVRDAIVCYQDALQVRRLEAFPILYRQTQTHLARLELQLQHWEEAHTAFTGALAAEELLVVLGVGTVGRDAVLQDGLDAAINDGFVLMKLSRFAEAAVVLERGRARGLAESMALDTAYPDLIRDPARRAQYEEDRKALVAAQATLQTPLDSALDVEARQMADIERTRTYAQAKAAFDVIVSEIRETEALTNFFDTSVDVHTLLRAAGACGQNHALVYLATTLVGGFALLVIHRQDNTYFAALELPELTETLVGELIESRIDFNKESVVVGGFAWAQERQGFKLLPSNVVSSTGIIFRQQAAFLHNLCAERGKVSMLDVAAQEIVDAAVLAEIVDQPLPQPNSTNVRTLVYVLEHAFLHHELQRCLNTLADTALRPLAAKLQEAEVKSVTFIPCGLLAAFPLSAVEITPGKPFGEQFVTSVAPNVRSLLRSLTPQTVASARTAIYTLGNPEPDTAPLVWGEAEAYTLAYLARHLHLHATVKVQQQATRQWLVEALNKGYIVDASCHGTFNGEEPLESALRLAQRKKLTLGQVLSREVNLLGLRLLILSACQTAIVDQRGVRDEVYSIAAAMLQAGATAVLAALWAVDDKATYLLMTCFAQEWFPKMYSEPPAVALARAQHWLRTVTNQELQVWEAKNVAALAEENRQEVEREAIKDILSRMSDKQLVGAGVRGDRYDMEEATHSIHETADAFKPDSCPYADPIYWAGFQILGW